MWDQQDRDADINGYDGTQALRQQQSYQVRQEGGDEEDEPPYIKESVQTHDMITDDDKEEGLQQGDEGHIDNLRRDIAAIR